MMNRLSFDKDTVERLNRLISILSPSMNERGMALYLRDLWTNAGLEVTCDTMGNIHGVKNKDADIHVGIVAHIDTVAIQITNILPNGLLKFRSIGLRPHTILGQIMNVVTRNGVIEGVIGFDTTSQFGQPKGLVEDDLWLDIGAKDCKDAASSVEIGDLAVLKPTLSMIGDDLIRATALDNRIGIFIMNECLSLFSESTCKNIALHLVGTVQEEIATRGASIALSRNPLNACFVVDVDYATDLPNSHENQLGKLLLGKGVGLHIKSDNNPKLRDLACQVAREKNIFYQKTLGRYVYGGTDATPIQLQNTGTAVINVNIPCRYMHSPVEICNMHDVKSATSLISSTIEKISDCKIKEFTLF